MSGLSSALAFLNVFGCCRRAKSKSSNNKNVLTEKDLRPIKEGLDRQAPKGYYYVLTKKQKKDLRPIPPTATDISFEEILPKRKKRVGPVPNSYSFREGVISVNQPSFDEVQEGVELKSEHLGFPGIL